MTINLAKNVVPRGFIDIHRHSCPAELRRQLIVASVAIYRGPTCSQMAQPTCMCALCSAPRHCSGGFKFIRGAYFVVLHSFNVDGVDGEKRIGRCFARHETVRNSPWNGENQLEWSNSDVHRRLWSLIGTTVV